MKKIFRNFENVKNENEMKEEKVYVINDEVWDDFFVMCGGEGNGNYEVIESTHLTKESAENRLKQLEIDAKKIVADDYNFYFQDGEDGIISPDEVKVVVREHNNYKSVLAVYELSENLGLQHEFTIEERPISRC